MARYPDWPQRLWAAIEARRMIPYQWGVNDCALYAADLVEAQTGTDFAVAFRGAYRDEAGAMALLAAHGWKDLGACVDQFLPRKEGRPQRGDVVLLPGVRGAFLAIVQQSTYAMGPDTERPRLIPIAGYLACWEVK